METAKPRKTQRKKPDMAQKKNQATQADLHEKMLVSAIIEKLGYADGRCDPKKLWEVEGISRYRVNWLDWTTNAILKSVFCHVVDASTEPKDSKDYEPKYIVST